MLEVGSWKRRHEVLLHHASRLEPVEKYTREAFLKLKIIPNIAWQNN